MMLLNIPASSESALWSRWRHCATWGDLIFSRSLSSVCWPSGSSATRRAVTSGSSNIPDSSMISDEVNSDRGGPAEAAPGDAVCKPAIAPCRSARVSPPAAEDVAFISPDGAAPGWGIPKFSRMFPSAST
ncbi:hypothetical protein ACHAWC_003385 [Mediolabrus comicus]